MKQRSHCGECDRCFWIIGNFTQKNLMLPELSNIIKRLHSIGYPESTVRACLPYWWHIDLESKRLAVAEAAAYISDELEISLVDLLTADKPLTRTHFGFKTPQKSK